MLERLTDLVNAMLNAVLGRLAHPEAMLSVVYHSIQQALMETRRQLAGAIATEEQLKVHAKKQPENAELQLKLAEAGKLTQELRQKLNELEVELTKAQTKSRVLNSAFGLNGPLEPIKLSSNAVLILLSFFILWLAGAVYMIAKHLS